MAELLQAGQQMGSDNNWAMSAIPGSVLSVSPRGEIVIQSQQAQPSPPPPQNNTIAPAPPAPAPTPSTVQSSSAVETALQREMRLSQAAPLTNVKPGSTVQIAPPNFFEENKTLIIGGGIAVVTLIALIILTKN